MLKILSKGILAIPNINIFLNEEQKRYSKDSIEAVVGWGHKSTATKARELAKELNVPYLALEDGFIRSIGLGVNNSIPLSISVDNIGCYYNASTPSLIEELLSNRQNWFTQELQIEAKNLIKKIIDYDISKYNSGISISTAEFSKNYESHITNTEASKPIKRLLLIDQCFGDSSLTLGEVPENVSSIMLEKANELYSDYQIFLKIHPDVLAKKRKGLFDLDTLPKNITIIDEDYTPLSLIQNFSVIFTASSQFGFEALMLGKKVHTFGKPFYASYGLTDDYFKVNRRLSIKNVTLLELFAAAYIKLCRYVNPFTEELTSLNEILEIIKINKELNIKFGSNFIGYCATPWKKEIYNSYLSKAKMLKYTKSSKKAIELARKYNATIIQWASKKDNKLNAEIKKYNIPRYYVEDGFIRSRGLGCTHEKPFSLVFDPTGIYYNPSSNSNLIKILNTIKERDDIDYLISQAKEVKNYLIQKSISKYNLSTSSTTVSTQLLDEIKKEAKNKTIILVPGQVETDASVLTGGGNINSNLALLEAVRTQNKDAYIVYKPHPDVLAQIRIGGDLDKQIAVCDKLVEDMNIIELLSVIDEVHTLTSLSGFEALIRDKKVVTYGTPFYAGWGVTTDHSDTPERLAKLTIDELIAGVLILYPVYYDWTTSLYARAIDICYRLEKTYKRPKDSITIKAIKALYAILRLLKFNKIKKS